ncbi:hypothetical protein S40285_05627 [Stachybotrys chlorohalonatus IBT 40285]|uniref:AB hydrolase-1 domain-containing protein n=1 Tax=Stachybotrys chlorohalonatus (strain IBT 40285) TaxID=1283841 RepID=A0A084QM34_STAC4|nr:hypothetical protein S40285_05627 [Stachybotrys chlorohalonata IBT 40285]
MDTQAFLESPCFNRIVDLDGIEGSSSYRVQYADYGYRNEASEDEKVLLFLGPMFASRMVHVAKNDFAERHKVRIIAIDRPGFGGTDAVGTSKRLDVTRAITIALLQHLGIRHVAVACQSGGTVYALDLLLHHPEILNPTAPYFAIGAPWVHPSHTGAFAMSMTSMLPGAAIGTLDKWVSLFQAISPIVTPVTGVALGASQIISGPGVIPSADPGDDEDSKREADLFPKCIKYAHTQSITGLSDEAIFLMKKVEGLDGWGDWGDYDNLLPRLSAALRAAGKRLAVDVYFAEKDMLIGDAGTKGTVWLTECFKKESETMNFESHVVKGANHDTVWDLKHGVPGTVFLKL